MRSRIVLAAVAAATVGLMLAYAISERIRDVPI